MLIWLYSTFVEEIKIWTFLHLSSIFCFLHYGKFARFFSLLFNWFFFVVAKTSTKPTQNISFQSCWLHHIIPLSWLLLWIHLIHHAITFIVLRFFYDNSLSELPFKASGSLLWTHGRIEFNGFFFSFYYTNSWIIEKIFKVVAHISNRISTYLLVVLWWICEWNTCLFFVGFSLTFSNLFKLVHHIFICFHTCILILCP